MSRSRWGKVRGTVCIVGIFLLVAISIVWQSGWFSENRALERIGMERGESSREDMSDPLVAGEIPLYLQKDKRWRGEKYGDDVMEITGCGPTCLSMVVCGLTKKDKWTPVRVARKVEKEGYYVKGAGSAWSLMTEGAEEFGLSATQLSLDEGVIRRQLEQGHPVICAMGPGDFTTEGHFIVLSGEDDEGNIIVRDPNSRARSEQVWDLEQLMPQMKNLWSYSL